MSTDSYSFLDVAVLDEVRQRFAAGDAIAILSADLDQVIWANGPGAEMFGYPDIETIIGAAARLPLVARRQVMATSGFPDIGRDRPVTMRLASGMTSRAVGVLASTVTMPDGEKAILLTLPAAQTGSRSAAEIAARAIGGFTEDGHFIAFIDGKGGIEAASEGFSALGIAQQTLAALVADIASESDRVVKRLVPGAGGSYPAGMARLTDDPARHLLVVIDEGQFDEAAGEADRSMEIAGARAAPQASPAPQAESAKPGSMRQRLAANSDRPTGGEVPQQHDHWYFSGEDAETPSEPAAKREPSSTAADGAPAAKLEPAAGTAEATRQENAAAPEPDRSAPPVRFAWRTDAEGKFSAISPEFADTVGQAAADVVGRRFKDVATIFGLDPSGEIAGLLERRDTWSGRSALWPVAGTDLKIPVDLAALPVYGRSRGFEGFRGFGVARPAEAVTDPEGIGLALVPNEAPPADADETKANEAKAGENAAERADPFQGEVPALTIVPKPERRFTDKVIRLAEHRQPANDKGLSTLERSAFREIGERLKKESTPDRPADGEKTSTVEPGQPAAGTSHDTTEKAAVSPSAKTADGDTRDEDALARLSDAEGVDDLERLDGGLPAEAGADEAPLADKEREGAQDRTDAARTPQDGVTEDDSMAAADLRDAQDDEDPTGHGDDDARHPDEDRSRPAASTERAGAEIGEDVEGSHTRARPLATEGFLPSAFPAGERNAPDTSILEKLPVPLLIHSGDILHYANGEFLDLTGYGTLDELAQAGGLGALFADPYTDDSASDGSDRTLRLKTQEGQELPIDALLRSVPWKNGKALMLVIRRTGEEDHRPAAQAAAQGPSDEPVQPETSELKARIAEMRTIIDTATDGVVLIARDGTIRSISRPAEALFSFDSDEVAGKPFASLFAIESQRAARDYLNGLSEHGVASVLNDGREVIGREAQGRFIPLFMTIGRLPNDSGFCAVVRDITQWKRAEEDLTQARAVAERASSQKTDFLARISHEIRTPLNAIIGFSELMVDEKFGPVANDRYRDYLRDINRSGNHVLDLVNDLLDISKIEAGQQEMDYEAVSLNDTLAETVAMMQPQANRERVIIRSSFASRLPEVVADLRSVRQIALNILSNAIRYTQAGGQVIVSTAYEPSGDVAMRVRDTGIGMSQAEIEQALKPFKQINALKRGRNDGTGLGLPLTKAMVEANRARFTINSTPGEGTLVEVSFPSTRVLAD